VECWIFFVLSIEVGWVSILYTLIHIIEQHRWFRRVPEVKCSQTSNRHTRSRHAIARMPVSGLDTPNRKKKEKTEEHGNQRRNPSRKSHREETHFFSSP
jgi:hypothetical protein